MTPAVRNCLSFAAVLLPLLNAQPNPPPAPAGPTINVEIPSQSWLGVGIADVNAKVAEKLALDAVQGVEVGHVAEGSPADEAGIERGDVITRFRGEAVQGVEHFARLVRETPPGREVELEVWDEDGRRDVEVSIGRRRAAVIPGIRIETVRPEPFDFDLPRPRMVVTNRSLGAELETVEGQLAVYFGVDEGILVRNVDSNTPAARAGLLAGDVIVEVAGDEVSNPAELRRAIGRTDEAKVRLSVVRKGAKRSLEVEVPRERSFGSPFRSRNVTRVQ